jgi:hypothetical protein
VKYDGRWCYTQQETILRAATAIDGRNDQQHGQRAQRSWGDQALESFGGRDDLPRLGDRSGLSKTIGNMGSVRQRGSTNNLGASSNNRGIAPWACRDVDWQESAKMLAELVGRVVMR